MNYKVTVAWTKEKNDFYLTFGSVNNVDEAVQQEIGKNDKIESSEYPFNNYEEMELELIHIKQEFPGVEV